VLRLRRDDRAGSRDRAGCRGGRDGERAR
jgi:hypothetical protein